MVSYGDGPTIDVLFVVRQDRVVANPVFAQDAERKLREGADAIMRPVVKRAQSQRSGYTVTWEVATPTPSRSRRSSTATTRSTSASRRSTSPIGQGPGAGGAALSYQHCTRDKPATCAKSRDDAPRIAAILQIIYRSQRMHFSAVPTAPASSPV